MWPAHGGRGDSRVGDVVVFGAHCPTRMTARVLTVPCRLKVTRCLRRLGRTAPARTTARVSAAVGRWEYEIALGRKVAASGLPLRRPAHGGGGDSRVGDVVVFGAHCPARTTARVGTAPGRRMMARLWRSRRTAPARMTARAGVSTAQGRWKCKIAPGREAAMPGLPLRRPAHDGRGDSRVGDEIVYFR
jgi:hypothetical protein